MMGDSEVPVTPEVSAAPAPEAPAPEAPAEKEPTFHEALKAIIEEFIQVIPHQMVSKLEGFAEKFAPKE